MFFFPQASYDDVVFMAAALLIIFATFTNEISSSLLRVVVRRREASMYVVGFVNTLMAVGLFFGALFFFPSEWRFSWSSLPTLIPLVLLTLIQAYVGLRAIIDASRSTYGFMRSMTIPLVLIIDLALGYALTAGQIFGILLIFVALFLMHLYHGLDRKGMGFVTISAVNAAITLSLYKYDITHFNSVTVEQLILNGAIGLFFFVRVWSFHKKGQLTNAFHHTRFSWQAGMHGLAAVATGFAYAFSSASLIVALERGLSVFWSVLFGKTYFHEQHFAVRLVGCSLIVSGLACLVLLKA